ncbi:MAG: hypothetical protein HQRvContig02_41 [Haloquadratum phage sp.]|nr:MAG: hypothetical protein HQRvContig02_41 [Haloquadratum phage sp.]
MSVDAPDGTTKSEPTNADTDATQERNNDRGRSGQATPVERPVSNDTNDVQSHKFTEQEHRTGLRRVEHHESWRAVYAACHVGVGLNE